MDEFHNRGSPRLHFTKEEMDNPSQARPIAKAGKAAGKHEMARKKLQSGSRLKHSDGEIEKSQRYQRLADELSNGLIGAGQNVISADGDISLADPDAPGVLNSKKKPSASKHAGKAAETWEHAPKSADMKDDLKAPAQSNAREKAARLRFEETPTKPSARIIHPVQKTVRYAGDQLHRQVAKANEKDNNAAVDAVLRADEVKKNALQAGEHAYHAHQFKHDKAVQKTERKLGQANVRDLEGRAQNEEPHFTSNPLSRWQQKRAIRKEYAAAKGGASAASYTQKTTRAAERAVGKTNDATSATVGYFKRHPAALVIMALGFMLLLVMSSLQSCSPLVQSVLESIVIGTYPAEEDDVLAAERAYAAKERELQDEMKHYEQYHPGYDEYHVEAAEIWHDPYVLIAIISAYFDGQEWTLESAYPVIEKYFNLQYVVTQTITTETRYRTETTTGTQIVTDPVTGEQHTEPYTYDVQVPYTYRICNVKLENKNLSHLPVVSMSHHTMGMYALYMASHGNREGIFSGNPHAVLLKDPMLYDIPQETLDADPSFAALMEEATKYIGYPYVWGGASPETSFDCSGFVSYVFTNSGIYNTGRLGAKGLRSLCRDVPEDQAKPGDIVFFEGTMGEDVAGITHCGIYVGDHTMLHCGSPIGYAVLTDSYWQTHFHSFGRVPN